MTLSVQAIKATGRSRAVPWFGASFVACCAIVIVFGFSFTFVPDVLGKIRPIWLYLHIAAAAAWLGLVVVQAVLAMQRKLALHRAIGAYGFGLGATAAVTAFITAFVLRHDSVVAHSAHDDAPGRIGRIASLAIPLNSAIVFSTLLACAWLWRHRPPMHRRFMLLATAVLTLPAIARIPGISEFGPLIVAPTDLLILTLCGIDLWREHAVHRVYWIAAPAVIAMQLLATFLIVAHPAWWVRTASILIGV